MTHEEAISAKQLIEEALKKYSNIAKEQVSITLSLKEETIKKFGIFKSKSYLIAINPAKNKFEIPSQVNSLEEAQKVIDYLSQLSISKLLSKVKNLALDSNTHTVNFEKINNEHQQIQNQKEQNSSEIVVGESIYPQEFFRAMRSVINERIMPLLHGDNHENIYPSFFLTPEGSKAFEQICNWKFNLSDINRVENYIIEIEKENIKIMSEKNEVYNLISHYLKMRENLLLSQEQINGIVRFGLKLLSDFQSEINQAKEILNGIKEENKTDNFKTNVEPYVEACAQAIEITITRIKTIPNMISKTSEYLTSQECKDILSTAILEKGNEHQKKYFELCEQIAENGGSFKLINTPSQTFVSRDIMTNVYLSSIEEARLFNGRVVSVYDQTVAGKNFYPVKTLKEKEYRDDVYNKYNRGYDSDGKKKEVLEEHKRQSAWYSGSDGSSYLWLKGVGFINTETETLLTAEEFKELEARGVKIVLTQGLDYTKEEIANPRMKNGSPYKSVYDFERSLSSMSFFRGEPVSPNKEALYKIMKENGLIPNYFGQQAIEYLDSKFGYYNSQEQEKDDATEVFNEFDYKQEVENIMYETETSNIVKSEDLDQADMDAVKDKIKTSLAEKMRKAGPKGIDSLAVTDEDLYIMPEIVTMTKIIAKEQGIDIDVEASENVEGNVTAVANYDRNKITFNLRALRRLNGFDYNVTRLAQGDIVLSSIKITQLIQTMLHEIKHFEQKSRMNNIENKTCDLETFKEVVENEIIKTGAGSHYYAKAHDNFLSEINADIYGWENCINYFKEYFGVDIVPSELIELRERKLHELAERKQPKTNTIIQGNGCLSTYLSNFGDKEYRESGKLVAEQFLEIIQSLEKKMTLGCDNSTESLIDKMKNKCKDIIYSKKRDINV